MARVMSRPSRLDLQQGLTRASWAEEEERRKVVLELHDGVSQLVAAALLEVRAITGSPLTSVEIPERAQIAEELLCQAVAEIDNLIHGLHSLEIQRRGLVTAIEGMVNAFSRASHISADLVVTGRACRDLRAEESLAVFRVVQEALNNVRKHSNAAKVEVRVEFGPSLLRVTVADDGKGFHLRNARDRLSGRMGLLGMWERAQHIGAGFTVESSIGSGSKICLELPLTPQGWLCRCRDLAKRILGQPCSPVAQ